MTIAPAIPEHYPDLNEAQRQVVAQVDGSLLVVAGPGSGITYSRMLRHAEGVIGEEAALA